MLKNQSHLFQIPEDIVYLNGAYLSPQLKSVEEAGITALRRKNKPYEITADDFFKDRKTLCNLFSRLIHVDDPERIAIIPSVSYGMANAIKNIHPGPGQEIVMLEEQFPSNYYGWERLSKETGVSLVIVKPPEDFKDRGKRWNQRLIEAINEKTVAVAIPHIHWADGTRFNLKNVRLRCDEVGALLLIDGTQSIGAYPFSVSEFRPDAVICGGYKWLMGPYSLGVAYYGERFDGGTPIEDNWINRLNSREFSKLTSYEANFEPKAARYGVGESSNFVLIPMLIKAIEQLLLWEPENIQTYCRELVKLPIDQLRKKGHWVEEDAYRASHLFGIYLAKSEELMTIKQRLLANNIHVSYRGNAIRVSPSIYNSSKHMEALVASL